MLGPRDLTSYYAALAERSSEVQSHAIKEVSKLARFHEVVENFVVWRENLSPRPEIPALEYAIQELQISIYATVGGLYRPGFVSLRLALELLLGVVHFSANRLKLEEWRGGYGDLNWATLIDSDNGIFSNRYVKAFLPDLGRLSDAQALAVAAYRHLSEFVHGNLGTLLATPDTIVFDPQLYEQYFEFFNHVSYLGNLVLTLRYVRELSPAALNKLEAHLLEELGHIPAIRDIFQKGIQ